MAADAIQGSIRQQLDDLYAGVRRPNWLAMELVCLHGVERREVHVLACSHLAGNHFMVSGAHDVASWFQVERIIHPDWCSLPSTSFPKRPFEAQQRFRTAKALLSKSAPQARLAVTDQNWQPPERECLMSKFCHARRLNGRFRFLHIDFPVVVVCSISLRQRSLLAFTHVFLTWTLSRKCHESKHEQTFHLQKYSVMNVPRSCSCLPRTITYK